MGQRHGLDMGRDERARDALGHLLQKKRRTWFDEKRIENVLRVWHRIKGSA